MKTYHIFISHAWNYNEAYYKVEDWLKKSNLIYSNYSVPEHDPLGVKTNKELKQALTNQISLSNIVIIISGMYAIHSDWIDYEIDEAFRMNKTIIGLEPWGHERIPTKVQKYATEMVGWNSQHLIKTIKNY